jgi:hypothetical protein
VSMDAGCGSWMMIARIGAGRNAQGARGEMVQ